jgi:hypothetical protein
MPTASKPHDVTVRAYQVGFGDCFLVTFHYTNQDRHVLIDCGSTGTPDGKNKQRLLAVAEDIKQRCGGQLTAVVASHRHADHINGFDTKGTKSPGKILASCKPKLVVQPWTEDPKAARNAKKATQTQAGHLALALRAMQATAARVGGEAAALYDLAYTYAAELAFIGQDNVANRAAVENLMKMAPQRDYVNFGSKTRLSKLLPGVKVWVLGPPTLEQTDSIRKQRSKDKDEFWMLQARFWALQARSNSTNGNGARLFRNTAPARRRLPIETRWFAKRVAVTRAQELLSLVRILDTVMNNTSVILLFEVNGKRLLFPGDAQIENWSYALNQPKVRELLKDVDLYKVGHHGSRNATPKSLWKLFASRSTTPGSKRLKTVVSTMAGKHGHNASNTEVPRRTLVQALQASSTFYSTQELRKPDLDANLEVRIT